MLSLVSWAVGCAAAPNSGGSGGTTGGGSGGSSSGTGGSGTGGGAPTCDHPATVNGHQLAPCGYYTEGSKIFDYRGQVKVLRGIARPSMEWSVGGEMLNSTDFTMMASWRPNVIRFSLNQDFYLAGAAKYSSVYKLFIGDWVNAVKAKGIDVILDLHWSDMGNLQNQMPGQQKMADRNSVTFWSQLAEQFKNDGRVIFELYNEPHDVPESVWRDGGNVDGWEAAGMQDLYDAVRATGAHNLVLIGGLDYGYKLDHLQTASNRINGYNIAYVAHPYGSSQFAHKEQPSQWDTAFGFLVSNNIAPVVATEFGDLRDSANCSNGATFNTRFVDYARQRGIGWTAWAWYVNGCTFPSLISDWQGTPNAAGMVIKSALATN